MKMTQQEIEAFYTQYWGQRVGVRNETKQRYKVNSMTILEIRFLELRSIESLTDEEKDLLMSDYDLGGNRDYLRKIGVATQFRNYSVDEMIEQGILKLK